MMPMMTHALSRRVDLATIVAEFYPGSTLTDSPIGRFEEVRGDDLPPDAAELLDHDHHMTVTLERFHRHPVRVVVDRQHFDDGLYCREITLTVPGDADGGGSSAAADRTVLYGLVCLDSSTLESELFDAIRRGETPLGRILIDADVLRTVERKRLWRITAGPTLARLGGVAPGAAVYGRTALIRFDGRPAIELLEVVV